MRSTLLYGFLLLAAIGCRPSVEDQDLGDVLYDLPNVPGAEEPYKLPNLEPETQPTTDDAAEKPAESADSDSPPATESADESSGDQPPKKDPQATPM